MSRPRRRQGRGRPEQERELTVMGMRSIWRMREELTVFGDELGTGGEEGRVPGMTASFQLSCLDGWWSFSLRQKIPR